MAGRDIPAGTKWGSAIIEAIEDSRVMVVVFSSNSNVSEHVLRELERAVNNKVDILQFRIENIPMSKDMEYFLAATQWFDASNGPLANHLDRLVSAVRASLGGQYPAVDEAEEIGLEISDEVSDLAMEPEDTELLPEELTNSVGVKLKLVTHGTFMMGSDKGRDDEKPAHEVTITKPFYLGVYPVIQAEYEAVMDNNPSYFRGPKRPVEQVTWNDAVEFCRRLSEKENVEYRPPTEAEWEYSCRAGSTTSCCFGDAVSGLLRHAWYSENSDKQTHEVGLKKPNGLGLYDMHGNVWEFCSDWYGPYEAGGQTDPTGAATGDERIRRGGSWGWTAGACRSACRGTQSPDKMWRDGGFRVARSVQ